MSLGQALRAFLISNATPATQAVAAKVGTRVYRMQAPQDDKQGTPPARIVYQRISCAPYRVVDGQSTMHRERYQLNCWGAGTEVGRDAEELADLVAKALGDVKGTWSYSQGGQAVNYKIHACRLDDARDMDAPPGDDSERSKQAVSLDFTIDYERVS